MRECEGAVASATISGQPQSYQLTPEATYAAAVKAFGERGLIDLIAAMGYYDMVAMTLIAAKAIPPKEADVPELMRLTP